MTSSLEYETLSSSSSSDEDSDDEYREPNGKEEKDVGDDEKKLEEVGESSDNSKREEGRTIENNHQCPHCDKTFKFPNKLKEHVNIHKASRYECSECKSPREFDTWNQLRAHQKMFHTQANHKCPQCSYTNSRPSFIRRHFQQNHIDGILCTVTGCGMRVAKNRMKNHLKEMHSTSIDEQPKLIRAKLSFHACPRCDYKPDESIIYAEEQHKDLMRHMEIMHEKRGKLICSFGCGKEISAEEMKEHWTKCPMFLQDEPSTSTPRLLDDCCQDTNTVTSQSVSNETSTGYPRDSETEIASTTAGLMNSLNEIELEQDNEVREPPTKKGKTRIWIRGDFSCASCHSTFTLIDHLKKHVRRCHSGNASDKRKTTRKENRFNCDRKSLTNKEELCSKSFRTEQALQDHFNVHDDIKPYACLTCSQRFHARDRFAVHLSKYHLTSIKDLNIYGA